MTVEPDTTHGVVFRTTEELVALRSVIASAVEECCEADTW